MKARRPSPLGLIDEPETGEVVAKVEFEAEAPVFELSVIVPARNEEAVLPGCLASLLAQDFTVVCPDLRGYGESRFTGTETPDHAAYSKRAMARDQVAVMTALGFERFSVAGHDRGGRVAYRLALDHPQRVQRLAVLDMVPTLEAFERMNAKSALGAYHWLFLAQPFPLPERLIAGDPDFYLDWTIKSWCAAGNALAPEAMAEYRRAFRIPEVVHAAC